MKLWHFTEVPLSCSLHRPLSLSLSVPHCTGFAGQHLFCLSHSTVVRKNSCTMNESHKYSEKKKNWKVIRDISYLFIYDSKQEKGQMPTPEFIR